MTAVGLRVLRGPDWEDGDADGGEGYLGTVISVLGNGLVCVLWDMGNESTCRAPGQSGQHDLRVWENGGICHIATQCAECRETNIIGSLWRCTNCHGCDLCSLCYSDDKHDLGHQFLRIDTPGSRGQLLQKRKSSVKVRTIGLHPGALVVRGKHWTWGNQDGGEGSEGEVKEFVKLQGVETSRNLVKVAWPNGVTNTYRFGFHGYVDLKCVEEETGPFYYRDHLRLLDVTRLPTQIATNNNNDVSDSAAIIESTPQISSTDRGIGLRMADTTIIIEPSGAVPPTTENTSSSRPSSKVSTSPSRMSTTPTIPHSSTFANPRETVIGNNCSSGYVTSEEAAATALREEEAEEVLSVGDKTAIKVGEDRLKELQQGWGGCTARMLRCIGRTGEVTAIAAEGLVSASFGETKVSYRFNPKVLMKVSAVLKVNSKVRIRPDCELQKVLNARTGWTSDMEQALGKVGRIHSVDSSMNDLKVDFNGCQFTFAAASCFPAADGAIVDTLQGGGASGSGGDANVGAATGVNGRGGSVKDLPTSLGRMYSLGLAITWSQGEVRFVVDGGRVGQ